MLRTFRDYREPRDWRIWKEPPGFFRGNSCDCHCTPAACCGGIPVTSGTAINVSFVLTAGFCADLSGATMTGTVTDTGTAWVASATITVAGVLYTFGFSCGYAVGAGTTVSLKCGIHQIAIAAGYTTLTCTPLDATGTLNVPGGITCAGSCFAGAQLDWHMTL